MNETINCIILSLIGTGLAFNTRFPTDKFMILPLVVPMIHLYYDPILVLRSSKPYVY